MVDSAAGVHKLPATGRPLFTDSKLSTSENFPTTTMTASSSSSATTARSHKQGGPRDNVSRRASIALLAADPSHDLPARLTTEPLLLKPAMQSCLKNPFRLSLPYSPSAAANASCDHTGAAPCAHPYPSPSIIFPSEADSRTLAFAQKMSEQQQSGFGVTPSQSAVHQHYDRTLERTAILEMEDQRRASDPDVATDFEAELFRWAEQQDSLEVSDWRGPHPASIRSVSGASSAHTGACNSPSGFDDGYRADLDSPMIDRQQHRVGTRIHTQAGARNKLRARAMAGEEWMGMRPSHSSETGSEQTTRVDDSPMLEACESGRASTLASPADEDEPVVKTPRFMLQTEMVPRIGSPTHNEEISMSQTNTAAAATNATPAIVLPMESPEQEDFEVSLRQKITDPSVARSRARASTLNAPKTPYNFGLKYDHAAASPRLLPPEDNSKERKACMPPLTGNPEKADRPFSMPPLGSTKQSATSFTPSAPIPIPGCTKLQSRRPSGMRLRNLPDASIWAPVEIEVNGKNLAGRDMRAVAVYDPRKDSSDAMGEALETAKAETEAKAILENASPQTGQALLMEGEVNPPPPTPPRGAHLRGAARVRAATLNAIALKVNMMSNAEAQEGTTLNAHIEEPESKASTPFVGLGVGIGLGLKADKDGRVHLHGANAPEYDASSPEECTTPKHRSLPNKLPEKVISRPEVENWLKDSRKPQPGDEESPKPKNMQAWALKTFEATGQGSEPGVINAPPSAYVGAAPSPCPGFNADSEAIPSPCPPPVNAEDDADDSDAEREQHRAAAEAKLNGTPLLPPNEVLEATPLEGQEEDTPERSPKPPMKKSFILAALPSDAVSLNSASTTASARPFFAGLAGTTAATTTSQPQPKQRAVNVPRTAVLAKDRARRPADASETDRSAQLDSVLAAFSTEQLLAHLATRRGVKDVGKVARKAGAGSAVAAASAATGVAAGAGAGSVIGDMSPRCRSPLVPQGVSSPGVLGSLCLGSRSGALPRSAKRNSAQRALARNRQRLAHGGENAGAPLMARMDSISSVGSADMVREDSVSSFGSFFSQSPLLVSSANVHVGSPGIGQDLEAQINAAQGPLIDLLSPESRAIPGFVPLASSLGAVQPPAQRGGHANARSASYMEPSSSHDSASSEPVTDDRVSLLTSTSSNQVTSSDLLTPVTGMSVSITPIGSLITSAFARAHLQTRAQTPLDFARGAQDDGVRSLRLGANEDEGADERGAMLMERSDSVASPALMTS